MLRNMDWARLGSIAYAIAFPAAFLVVAIWESWNPVRSLASAAGRRWRNHVLLYAVSAACSWVAIRVTPVVVALAVQTSPVGLLNGPRLPLWARWAITLPVLDLVLYASHRLMHSVYVLWRVHAVHHSDRDYDVSTAGRFHPIEVLFTQGMYLGAIALLAPPLAAVFTWQILIVFENMFTTRTNSRNKIATLANSFPGGTNCSGHTAPRRPVIPFRSRPDCRSWTVVSTLLLCAGFSPCRSPQLPPAQRQHSRRDETIRDRVRDYRIAQLPFLPVDPSVEQTSHCAGQPAGAVHGAEKH
jgi:hypothetical protein